MTHYADHIEQRETSHLKRMERVALALTDPNVTHELYRALARIVGTAQVEQVRAIACDALMSVDFWTPPVNTMNTFSPELDALQEN